MTKRREFSRKQRAEIIAESLNEKGQPVCALCRAVIGTKAYEIDHILPLQLGGESKVENGQLICVPCLKEKTGKDVRAIRKSDRQRDKHTGAFKGRQRSALQSRGFTPAPKQNSATTPINKWKGYA